MLKHFTGTHDHRMDDKGRVSLPTEFRRVLGTVESPDAVYVVPQLENSRSLAFFSTVGYGKLIDRHNETTYPSPADEQRMEIKLISHASQIQVDDVGRIVIPKGLRDLIGLEKEVRFVGHASRFEIWRPDARAAYEDELLAGAAEQPVHINLKGLH